MYYDVSSRLIEHHPLERQLIIHLDREIARAYDAGGYGYVEVPLLSQRTGVSLAIVPRWLDQYQAAGILERYQQVQCCAHPRDPSDGTCLDCGKSLADADPTGVICYRVQARPVMPAYDPGRQPADPQIFISYRHAECAKLASDIYYSLTGRGYAVFLNNGSIPVGADAERVFLRAASHAPYFIALVSRSYFGSPYCKKEIAHAARCGNRLVRVNIPPVPPAPNDMPWIDRPNWNPQQGTGNRLDTGLENSLLAAVQTSQGMGMIADLRREACQFLMEQLSLGELQQLWNRLGYMGSFAPGSSTHDIIRVVLQESTGDRLRVLCTGLGP